MEKTNKNKAYAWGIGRNGQLGLDMKKLAGKTKCFMVPGQMKMSKSTNITSISCFSNYSLALDQNGNVHGCGSNLKGRLGIEEKVDVDFEFPMQIKSLVNIVKIDCGYWHSLALDQNRQAWSAGYNTHGELGRQITATDSDIFGKVA